MNERTDFAEVLVKALGEQGYKNFGKIDVSEEEKEDYFGQSPKQMAVIYAKKNFLKAKTHLLKIIIDIYNLNKQGIFKYPMRDRLYLQITDYTGFLFLFRYGNTHLKMTGNLKTIRYEWMKKEFPTFEDAEKLYDRYKKMRSYSFSPEEKNYIKENADGELDKIYEDLGILTGDSAVGKLWGIKQRMGVYKWRINKDEKTKQEKKPNLIFDKEISRTAPLALELQKITIQPANVENKPPVENQHPTKEPSIFFQLKEEVKEEGYLFLLSEKAEMYRKIAMDFEKYNQRLEAQIVKLYEKLSQKINP